MSVPGWSHCTRGRRGRRKGRREGEEEEAVRTYRMVLSSSRWRMVGKEIL